MANLILLLLCYLIGFIFYYIKLDKDYFSKMEKNMREQKVEAGGTQRYQSST